MKVTDTDPERLDLKDVRVTIEDGDDIEIFDVEYEGDTFKLICCDCGLTHKVGIVRCKATGEIKIYFERDERATAQNRRQSSVGLHDGVGKWKLVRID